MAETKRTFHWPVMVLGIVVAVIFAAVLFVFEVNETEFAVKKRLGRPLRNAAGEVRVYDAGLHFKWPFIDTVWRHDKRLQPYEMERGQVAQVQTQDDYQVIVTTFVLWRVGDPHQFLKAFDTTEEAQEKLNEVIRNSRNSVVAGHRLTEMVNTDPAQVRLGDIEAEILDGIQEVAFDEYGIRVTHVGLKFLGFPEQVSVAVQERMREERQKRVQDYESEGEERAKKIRTEADLEAKRILTEAEAEATRIRGEGDREAAGEYVVFQENPELAAFLRKLEALRKTISDKTTLVVDTQTPPFDLLLPDALKITVKQVAEPAAADESTEGDGQ